MADLFFNDEDFDWWGDRALEPATAAAVFGALLSEYVKLSQNEQAEAYVAGLSETTQQLIGSFDTGCWSRYSLDGNPATTGYHTYHVKLLERLARETNAPFWRETGRRWRGYLSAGGC